jgi:hypothetical protein
MSMAKVESGIPMPAKRYVKPRVKRRGRPMKYPWRKMKVGDSAFFEGQTTDTCNNGRAYNSAGQYGRLHGMKFSGHNEPAGVRIWRVK